MSLHGSMPLRLTVHSLPIGDTDTYLLRDLPLCSFSNARRGTTPLCESCQPTPGILNNVTLNDNFFAFSSSFTNPIALFQFPKCPSPKFFSLEKSSSKSLNPSQPRLCEPADNGRCHSLARTRSGLKSPPWPKSSNPKLDRARNS